MIGFSVSSGGRGGAGWPRPAESPGGRVLSSGYGAEILAF